jgi:hypothetical protein
VQRLHRNVAPVRQDAPHPDDEERDVAPDDDVLRSADALLRYAAVADASEARELVAQLPAARLLEVVVSQAELAVDVDRPRPAGIDVVAELGRAAIEELGLPQEAQLELADDPELGPAVTGWELVTVQPDELPAATLALPVRPWHLVLVAFDDEPPPRERPIRHVVAAAADGRVVATRLRLGERLDQDHDLLGAHVSDDPADLGPDAALASALLAAIQASVDALG